MSAFCFKTLLANLLNDDLADVLKTAAQSKQKNLDLSQERAQSVSTYLMSCGITSAQIKGVQGLGEDNPVADNSTAAGRQENRRVEVYMYASPEMIQQAEAGTAQ